MFTQEEYDQEAIELFCSFQRLGQFNKELAKYLPTLDKLIENNEELNQFQIYSEEERLYVGKLIQNEVGEISNLYRIPHHERLYGQIEDLLSEMCQAEIDSLEKVQIMTGFYLYGREIKKKNRYLKGWKPYDLGISHFMKYSIKKWTNTIAPRIYSNRPEIIEKLAYINILRSRVDLDPIERKES